MKLKLTLICCIIFFAFANAQDRYDIVIVGGNPGGITAAIAAAREGKSSVILERTAHIGGLPVNGLGATDIATKEATTGLFREFADRNRQAYVDKYGESSEQVRVSNDGIHFEASVASETFRKMIGEYGGKIIVLTMRQFDAEPQNLEMKDGRILSLTVTNRVDGNSEVYVGDIFIDATYEGDLGSAAGVPFRVGREDYEEFREPGAGRLYKYWRGTEAVGTTMRADNAVQSYNYRLCLTNNPANRREIEKPANYNREEYVSLIDDVLYGRNTNAPMQFVTQEMMDANKKHIEKGNPTQIPGDNRGIAKITNIVMLPNAKTDANNQHGAFISTDLPEENWPWPTSSWEWRDRFARRLKEYTLGLFWFAQNDKALPENFRKAASEWGFARDEYTDNDNFPRQVYVREGRRFEGVYFFTAHDAIPVMAGQRPPIHKNSITSSHYALDSHAVRKREQGRVHLDGFFSYPTEPYTVPYGVIVTKEVDNLLIPIPVSGSHVGFSTLRMEPCWMALGQASGVAASLAIDEKVKIKNVDIEKLQEKLLSQNATLIYFRDMKYTDPDFKLVQTMAMKGYLTDWEAGLSLPVTKETIAGWQKLSGKDLKAEAGRTTRREVLKQIIN